MLYMNMDFNEHRIRLDKGACKFIVDYYGYQNVWWKIELRPSLVDVKQN